MTANTQIDFGGALIGVPEWIRATGEIPRTSYILTRIRNDVIAGINDEFNYALQMSYINKANMDWNLLHRGFILHGNQKERSASYTSIWIAAVYLHITKVPPILDYWWGTGDIAKYGCVRQSNGGAFSDIRWVNSVDTIIAYDGSRSESVQVNLQPGVEADVWIADAITYPVIYSHYSGNFQPFPSPECGPWNVN